MSTILHFDLNDVILCGALQPKERTKHRVVFYDDQRACPKCRARLLAIDTDMLARKTQDAFSSNRYASWPAVCRFLLKRGYNAAEAEQILRSRWTRYAADTSEARNGMASVAHLERWLDETFNMNRIAEARDVHAMMVGILSRFSATYVPSTDKARA